MKRLMWRAMTMVLWLGVVAIAACSESENVVPQSSLRRTLAGLDWGKDTTFVYGHKTPDVDAATSALSYAKLMRALGYNCKAKVSTPVNRESVYISKLLGFELPELKTQVAPETRLILTDHSDYAQCVDGAREAIILQKIDHHVEGDIADAQVPYVRREMVGSTCTIIYECYNELGVAIDDETAAILLAGILSDTRNLTKTTTRGIDSVAWRALVTQLELQDRVDEISQHMAEAAYDYSGMTDEEILLSDYKEYEMGSHLIGFGSLACRQGAMDEFITRMLAVMPQVMEKRGRQMMFAKIDELVENTGDDKAQRPLIEAGTYFIYYGQGTQAIAEAIFGTSLRPGVTYTSEKLSRKQIVPRIQELLGD